MVSKRQAKPNERTGATWLLWLGVILLSACSTMTADKPLPGSNPDLYLPPTSVADKYQASLPSTPTAAVEQAPLPTPTPDCVDNLLFLDDLTIPDGSPAVAGEILDKRWEVRNNGNCNWDSRYRLKLIAGPALEASIEQALYPARSGAQAVVRIQFSAPEEAGRYRSAWQAHNPQDQPFGDPIFIEFTVPASEEATPTPEP